MVAMTAELYHASQVIDQHGDGAAVSAAVAQLTILVVTPALHLTLVIQYATVLNTQSHLHLAGVNGVAVIIADSDRRCAENLLFTV
ncbi:Uncharacterised protein [Candidatus Venteria ishoeyi]|uniref:Uncharacterized protein n=1 Tax=Candidatus Venteria ishoeyi TaxID=1899563 RepID=A0A1H6F8D1_9GAMM|nr:Uncharacterised protein [Candidatus Venteria ishoeyi]